MALSLDLAADRLEVANLVTGHGTYVGAVEHDDGPARVRCCGLVWDRHDFRCCLSVGRLELQGDGMGAAAQALMVCRRDGQQALQNAHSIPKRSARAQLRLHPLQLRRAAGRQQRANRRDRHLRQGRRPAATAPLEPRRLDLDRAEQRLQPTRAPVLERLQHPASRAGPVISRILRHLPTQHARLQLGQQCFRLGQHKTDLRQRADHPRTAERHQLRRLHLALARPRFQPHRPLHQARSPWSGISQADQTQTSKPPAPGF